MAGDKREETIMPLLNGSSDKAFISNVGELMHSYKSKGKIGNSHPKNKKKALRQALAIAFSKKRESQKGGS